MWGLELEWNTEVKLGRDKRVLGGDASVEVNGGNDDGVPRPEGVSECGGKLVDLLL